jgi:hypothetical protein
MCRTCIDSSIIGTGTSRINKDLYNAKAGKTMPVLMNWRDTRREAASLPDLCEFLPGVGVK